MPDTDNNPKPTNKPAYRVLCWGACNGDKKHPCRVDYTSGGKEKTAVTGDVVSDLPTGAIGSAGQEDYHTLIIGKHVELVEGE